MKKMNFILMSLPYDDMTREATATLSYYYTRIHMLFDYSDDSSRSKVPFLQIRDTEKYGVLGHWQTIKVLHKLNQQLTHHVFKQIKMMRVFVYSYKVGIRRFSWKCHATVDWMLAKKHLNHWYNIYIYLFIFYHCGKNR